MKGKIRESSQYAQSTFGSYLTSTSTNRSEFDKDSWRKALEQTYFIIKYWSRSPLHWKSYSDAYCYHSDVIRCVSKTRQAKEIKGI